MEKVFIHAEGATHVDTSNKSRKAAFTLAEVLITLGIIGVVAAITLPTLIKNYQKKVTAMRAKHAYSLLMQAIKLSEVDNGDFKSWDTTLSNKQYTQKYIEPYFKNLKLCNNAAKCPQLITSNERRYFLDNGMYISFYVGGNSSYRLLVIVDIDGIKGKNRLGRDRFYFSSENRENRLMPFAWHNGISRNDTKKGGLTRCAEGSYHGCTLLLMLDGWEIKDDYPW